MLTNLYILHATSGGAANGVTDGTLIGQYTMHYEDTTVETIPIVYGEDVRDWWNSDPKAVSRGYVAWRGSNPAARIFNHRIRLYLTTWENPHPKMKVVRIDYVSTNTNSSPFCVAMTVEEPVAKGQPAANTNPEPTEEEVPESEAAPPEDLE